MTISNDREFKAALRALPVSKQRQLAARFTERVLQLCQDARVAGAVRAAYRADVTGDELAVAFQGSKAASVETYTRCGREAKWSNQAGHFVADAAMACVRPTTHDSSHAWDAAMSARMARTCQTIATGEGTDDSESQAQYRIVEDFLQSEGSAT